MIVRDDLTSVYSHSKLHLRQLAGDLVVPSQADLYPLDQRRHEHLGANLGRKDQDRTVAAILGVVIGGRDSTAHERLV